MYTLTILIRFAAFRFRKKFLDVSNVLCLFKKWFILIDRLFYLYFAGVEGYRTEVRLKEGTAGVRLRCIVMNVLFKIRSLSDVVIPQRSMNVLCTVKLLNTCM